MNKKCKECGKKLNGTRRKVFCGIKCGKKNYNERPHVIEKRKEDYKNNRLNIRTRAYESNLMRNFGITLAEYEKLSEQQNHLCAICTLPEATHNQFKLRKLSVDHCHTTGKVRGLLCSSCNNGLGRFKDNSLYLRKAARYLDEHTK